MVSEHDSIRILGEPDPVRGEEALRDLQEVGPSCLPLVLPKEGGFASNVGSRFRRRISRLCVRFGEGTLAHVADVLEHGGYHEKTLAIDALRGFRYDFSSRSCSKISRLLDHANVNVQRAAILAIGSLGAYHLTGHIIELFDGFSGTPNDYLFDKLGYNAFLALLDVCARSRNGADPEAFSIFERYFSNFAKWRSEHQRWNDYRDVFCRSARGFGKPSLDLVLQRWLVHSDELLRFFAQQIVEELRVERSVPFLAEVLANRIETAELRGGAARAIGSVGGPAAVEVITAAVFQSDFPDPVRSGVLGAYAALAFDKHLPLFGTVINEITKDPIERLTLGYSLSIRGEQRWDLGSALKSPEPTARAMTALTLARLFGLSAVPKLREASRDASDPVERAIVLAALVSAGDIDKSEELHRALCEWPSAGQFPIYSIAYNVRREFLWALNAGGLPATYPRAWANEMELPLERVDEEFRRMVRVGGEHAGKSGQYTASPPKGPRLIFLSYSKKDARWKNELLLMISPLTEVHELFWIDADVIPGAQWDEEIKTALSRATIALLLVTKNFFASEYIANVELPRLVERAKHGDLKIGWIACGHAMHHATELSAFQALNDPSKPLDSFRVRSKRDQELVAICARIKRMVDQQTPSAEPRG